MQEYFPSPIPEDLQIILSWKFFQWGLPKIDAHEAGVRYVFDKVYPVSRHYSETIDGVYVKVIPGDQVYGYQIYIHAYQTEEEILEKILALKDGKEVLFHLPIFLKYFRTLKN